MRNFWNNLYIHDKNVQDLRRQLSEIICSYIAKVVKYIFREDCTRSQFQFQLQFVTKVLIMLLNKTDIDL